MISKRKDNRLYLEDIEDMIFEMEKGIHFCIVDVFKDYFDLDSIPSYLEEKDGEFIEENSSNC